MKRRQGFTLGQHSTAPFHIHVVDCAIPLITVSLSLVDLGLVIFLLHILLRLQASLLYPLGQNCYETGSIHTRSWQHSCRYSIADFYKFCKFLKSAHSIHFANSTNSDIDTSLVIRKYADCPFTCRTHTEEPHR